MKRHRLSARIGLGLGIMGCLAAGGGLEAAQEPAETTVEGEASPSTAAPAQPEEASPGENAGAAPSEGAEPGATGEAVEPPPGQQPVGVPAESAPLEPPAESAPSEDVAEPAPAPVTPPAAAQPAATPPPDASSTPPSPDSAPAVRTPVDAPPAAETPVPGPAAAEPAAGEPAQPPEPKRKGRAIKESPPPTGRNAVGFTLGTASGFGVSYRRYLTNMVALRVEGLVLANSERALFSFGLTGQQDFLRTSNYRLYALEAVALHKPTIDAYLLAPGVGVGYEYDFQGFTRGLAVRGELVLTAVVDLAEGLQMLTPLPQVGFFYVF